MPWPTIRSRTGGAETNQLLVGSKYGIMDIFVPKVLEIRVHPATTHVVRAHSEHRSGEATAERSDAFLVPRPRAASRHILGSRPVSNSPSSAKEKCKAVVALCVQDHPAGAHECNR
jgi:hypothetical protein